jgi:hypothetical protein
MFLAAIASEFLDQMPPFFVSDDPWRIFGVITN